MSAIWVEILATRGSAPRDAGTAMKVTAESSEGTIGGGALEYAAITRARRMLETGAQAQEETVPLGPGLGQCCGGSVTLRYGMAPRPTDAAARAPRFSHDPTAALNQPLWIWGAGHVGRAVVAAAPLDLFDITWIDSGPERFPEQTGTHIQTLPAADMPLLARRAPMDAHHLIFTYSHEIDLALCAALLRRGFASCGLIGSATKWARFQKRLREMGLDPGPITCPIGDKSLGKAPPQIAQGVVAALLAQPRMKATA